MKQVVDLKLIWFGFQLSLYIMALEVPRRKKKRGRHGSPYMQLSRMGRQVFPSAFRMTYPVHLGAPTGGFWVNSHLATPNKETIINQWQPNA